MQSKSKEDETKKKDEEELDDELAMVLDFEPEEFEDEEEKKRQQEEAKKKAEAEKAAKAKAEREKAEKEAAEKAAAEGAAKLGLKLSDEVALLLAEDFFVCGLPIKVTNCGNPRGHGQLRLSKKSEMKLLAQRLLVWCLNRPPFFVIRILLT